MRTTGGRGFRATSPLWIAIALCAGMVGTASSGAGPVPSTAAPHPTAGTATLAGMTLEIRSGRCVVTDVAKGSPAERAGVLRLDVVLVVNGRSVSDLEPLSPQQILGLLQEATPSARLVLGRGPGSLSVELPLSSSPEPDKPRPSGDLRPGSRAPQFSGRDLKGKSISLKDLRGRIVLIEFWASDCPPCERAVIPIRRIAEQYSRHLDLVGVSLDVDRKSFEAFVYNHHLPGAQLFDGSGWRGEIPRMYGVADIGIPYYVLLDREGRIESLGELQEIEEAIVRLVGGR